MKKILLIALALTCLALGTAWAEESTDSKAEATPRAEAPATVASGPSSKADAKHETLDDRYYGGCSVSITCPGSPRFGVAPYLLTCEGNYSCYLLTPYGEVGVKCDGFGTLCFPGTL